MYSLKRVRDGAGDSGGMSMAIWKENEEVKVEHNARPRIGVAMRVGSIHARSYQHQDWWQTTLISEIISDEPKKVVFKTSTANQSVYTWTCD